jgi:hypothetical protein
VKRDFVRFWPNSDRHQTWGTLITKLYRNFLDTLPEDGNHREHAVRIVNEKFDLQVDDELVVNEHMGELRVTLGSILIEAYEEGYTAEMMENEFREEHS